MTATIFVGDDPIGRVIEIEGPTWSIDTPPLDGPDEYIPALLNSNTLMLNINPWRFPDGLLEVTPNLDPREVTIYATARPAWWGRIKNWLLQREPPTFVLARTHANLAKAELQEPPDGLQLTFRVVGAVEADAPPVSRLEAAWSRLCSTLKRPFAHY